MIKSDGKDFFNREKKKISTLIKHEILREVLEVSLGTANMIVRNRNFTNYSIKDMIYSYVDLYAGQGIFALEEELEFNPDEILNDEDRYGTPLYAYKIFKEFLETKGGKAGGVYFESLNLILCEKEESYRENLKKFLSDFHNKTEKSVRKGIKFSIHSEWEKEKDTIKNLIGKSKFGLIFIDPFNLEASFNEIHDLLKGVVGKYDILMFINFGHIRRMKSRQRGSDKERIKAFLGLSDKEFEELSKLESKDMIERVSNRMSELFLSLKRPNSFVLTATIPIQVKDKTIKQEYFGLILVTGAVSVAEAFVKKYAEAVTSMLSSKPTNIQKSIFIKLCLQVKQFRSKHLDIKQAPNQFTLYEIVRYVWSNILSFKSFIESYVEEEVPSIKNIIKCLNKMHKENLIDYSFDYREVNNNYISKSGFLKHSSIRSIKDLYNIKVKFLS